MFLHKENKKVSKNLTLNRKIDDRLEVYCSSSTSFEHLFEFKPHECPIFEITYLI